MREIGFGGKNFKYFQKLSMFIGLKHKAVTQQRLKSKWNLQVTIKHEFDDTACN